MFILDALIQKTLLEVLWILSILRLCGGGGGVESSKTG